MADLREPEGWFLQRAEHTHSLAIRPGRVCEPHKGFAPGPWLVVFQQYPDGRTSVCANGVSLQDAWQRATALAEAK